MGDFNLQMNDSYQGKVFKGCPTYEQGQYWRAQMTLHAFPLTQHMSLLQFVSQVWMDLISRSIKVNGTSRSFMIGLSLRQVKVKYSPATS